MLPAFAGCGALAFSFVHAGDRRSLIWGLVGGMVLAIVGSVAFTRLTTESPNSYASVSAYQDKLSSILDYAIPLGAWAGVILGSGFLYTFTTTTMRNPRDAEHIKA